MKICCDCKKPAKGKHECGARIKRRASVNRRFAEIRLEVLKHYSKGTVECAKCGEDIIEFLAIDHINGRRDKRKSTSKLAGIWLYKKLQSMGYPKGFQVLCHNCNYCKYVVTRQRDVDPTMQQRGGIRLERLSGRVSKKSHNEANSRYRKRRRLSVLDHYSKGERKCKCCSESNELCLTIDHVKGEGAKHRRSVGDLYGWLIRNNYPKAFQVLCQNCNLASGLYGECPHV